MIDTLVGLSERDLQEAANALRSGRLLPPYSTVALQRVVSREAAEPTARALDKLSEQGFTPAHIAITLEVLRADRASRPAFDDMLELVTTGPEIDGIANRDTSVVCETCLRMPRSRYSSPDTRSIRDKRFFRLSLIACWPFPIFRSGCSSTSNVRTATHQLLQRSFAASPGSFG